MSGQGLSTRWLLLILHAVLYLGFHHLIQRDVFHFHPILHISNRAAWEAFKSLLWELKEEDIREALPLSCEVQKGPPFVLNSFSERSLGANGSDLSHRLSNFVL